MLRSRQVDGIVLGSVHGSHNSELLQRIAANGGALVMIDRDDHPRVRCHRVLTDDELVGRMATEHLIAQGRRAIGHIAGPPITHARRREAGYAAALRDAGIEASAAWIVRGGFMETDGYHAMQALLAVEPAIDAVFAANDPAAIGALQAIWEAGLRVPDDIAVVGAGDIAHGDLLRVPLTTVGWAKEELGRRAAELILEQISGREELAFRRVIIPPHIVVRESCGARLAEPESAAKTAGGGRSRSTGGASHLKLHPNSRPALPSRFAAGSKRPR
jgi:LacI family transcriptional regulator, galactose operon repressor